MQIVKVPGLNNLGNNGGCRDAGNAILAELRREIDLGFEIEEIHVDHGDVVSQEKLIYENSKESFENHERVIFLGGDHSISYSIVNAFNDVFGSEDSYLIVFDAHADCMPVMKEPTHEEWLRGVIEKGFNPSNIVLVGLRRIELEERRFLDSRGIKYYEMERVEDLEVLCDFVMEFVNGIDKKVYVSFDIDVVDPAFAPSTGYPEPGGFNSREILYFARRISKLKGLKGVDVVEIDSESDKARGNISVKLGAKIVKEFL